jgi:hypothetical protein
VMTRDEHEPAEDDRSPHARKIARSTELGRRRSSPGRSAGSHCVGNSLLTRPRRACRTSARWRSRKR